MLRIKIGIPNIRRRERMLLKWRSTWSRLYLGSEWCQKSKMTLCKKSLRKWIMLWNAFVSLSVQLLCHVQIFVTPWITASQASLSITNSQSSLKPMPIESVMPSSHHLIFYCPLLLLSPIPPNIRVFSNESALHMRWPKYWSFSFSISPSNEHPRLSSFRMDWLDLLAVQGTLKSLLQYHSSKASILQHSAFFSPTLTSIHDPWKNHSLDQTDLCWQSNVSAF